MNLRRCGRSEAPTSLPSKPTGDPLQADCTEEGSWNAKPHLKRHQSGNIQPFYDSHRAPTPCLAALVCGTAALTTADMLLPCSPQSSRWGGNLCKGRGIGE